jgi:hypothetical protein
MKFGKISGIISTNIILLPLFAFISETYSLHDGMLDNLDVLSFADKYSFTSPKSVYIYFHFVS